MNRHPLRENWRWSAAALAATIAAGCASPPPAPPPKPAEPAVVQQAPPPPAPVEPVLSPAEAKAQAQKLAIDAIDLLQNGNEADARGMLEKATTLDPSNDLARKLLDQVNADAQKELGSTYFRYTVQRDDSLSKIAQTYLGDKFKFYILAKYNDIANPSRLAAGQVIKIPGRAPVAPPPTAKPAAPPQQHVAEPAPAPAPAPAAEPEPAPTKAVSSLMQQGMTQQKSGDLEAAYASFSEAAKAEPNNKDAVMQRDAVKVALLRKYDREALQAYRRQNLDLAIQKWDKVLELDPNNQKAKLERARAVELKTRMAEKFGTGGSATAAGTAK
jgi:LysM repeat protein